MLWVGDIVVIIIINVGIIYIRIIMAAGVYCGIAVVLYWLWNYTIVVMCTG